MFADYKDFTQLLDQQATIDQYADWASNLVNRCVFKVSTEKAHLNEVQMSGAQKRRGDWGERARHPLPSLLTTINHTMQSGEQVPVDG